MMIQAVGKEPKSTAEALDAAHNVKATRRRPFEPLDFPEGACAHVHAGRFPDLPNALNSGIFLTSSRDENRISGTILNEGVLEDLDC